MNAIDINAVENFLKQLQNDVTNMAQAYEPTQRFLLDDWHRQEGGGGQSRVLTDGAVFEKAGVNFSNIQGDHMPATATHRNKALAGRHYQAMGVSVVFHPLNPMVPTAHMNVRFFIAHKKGCDPIWWFGGGFDLTPYYISEQDVIHWHRVAKQACAMLREDEYLHYKNWCDEYFHLKHRNEQRGIGGLFFDDLNQPNFEHCFAFIKSVGQHFIKAYNPIVARRHVIDYEPKHRDFQLYRRGRYVEFNLVYDRGTLFGLQSDGRVESILMSMPPQVSFKYDWRPETGSEEATLYDYYLVPRDWLSIAS